MKRSRTVSRGNYRDDAVDSFGPVAKPPEAEKNWAESVQGQPDTIFSPYSLQGHFAQGGLLVHPTFGKGIVLAVDGRRIDVLFETGHKKLGHAG